MQLDELSEYINIDIKGSLERFSNFEPMYIKYLKRFNQEHTFDAFELSIRDNNLEEIENTAHTLKGICGNLGLSDLFDVYNDIVQAVRSHENDKIGQLAQRAIADTLKYREILSKLD